jgi:hypothetical protein
MFCGEYKIRTPSAAYQTAAGVYPPGSLKASDNLDKQAVLAETRHTDSLVTTDSTGRPCKDYGKTERPLQTQGG